MRKMKLLQLPSDFSDWYIFDDFQFGDNGGDPDGPLWLQDVRLFTPTELKAAKEAGAKVISGYEVDYQPTDGAPFNGHYFCGYQSSRTAYTTSDYTARAIQRHYEAFQVAAR